MTLYEYTRLDVNARADYLWAHGTFLANGNDGTAPAAYYSLEDFFVEVVFDLEFSTVVTVAPFNTGERYERLVRFLDVPRIG